MADRTHEAEDDLTGHTAPTRSGSGKVETPGNPHVYQEGSVDSIGERPTDADRDDRTGQSQTSATTRGNESPARDEFISSEVAGRTSRPMRDSKTRS